MGEIARWLASIGLGGHVDAFECAAIDFDVMDVLSDADLGHLGLPLGDRLRLRRALAARDRAGDLSVASAHAERRPLTVLFIDLVGSTSLSTRFDPEEMLELMRDFRTAAAGEIARAGGFVASFPGDGVISYFGYPRASENAAECAVRAALAVLRSVGRLTTPTGEALHARAGVASGVVIVGDLIGDGANREEGVIGETPNLAARLQAEAGIDEVMVAPATVGLTKGHFDVEHVGERQLKGFARPIAVYKVTGERHGQSRFVARRGRADGLLIGRRREIDRLWQLWGECRDGRGRMVLVGGEAGVGKSHLIESFAQIVETAALTRIRLYCAPHLVNSALYPVIQQLRRAAGLNTTDSSSAQLGKLKTLLEETWSEETASVLSVFAELLSIPHATRQEFMMMKTEERRERTVKALLETLVRHAALQPLLVIVEDAHWLDPTTSELLERAMPLLGKLPIVVLITHRPGFRPSYAESSDAVTIQLERLDNKNARKLVLAITGGKSLPDDIIETIVERSDGIPLFVEELTRTLLESAELAEAGDRYVTVSPFPPMAIPLTLQDSLMARLDRVGPSRRVAQLAAAIGRVFSFDLLAAALALLDGHDPAGPDGHADPVVENGRHYPAAAIADLERLGLVQSAKLEGSAAYGFRHALIRDAAYLSLLRDERRHYHLCIAGALERRFGLLSEHDPETLALHYSAADQPAKAVQYWREAGVRAAERSSNVEAVAHYSAAREQVRRLPAGAARDSQELAISIGLAGPLIAIRGFTDAEVDSTVSRALELARGLGEMASLFPLLYARWAFIAALGQMDRVLDQAREFQKLARQSHADGAMMFAERLLSQAFFLKGRFVEAYASGAASVALYEPERDSRLVNAYGQDGGLIGMTWQALAALEIGREDEARALRARVLKLAERCEHAMTLGYVWSVAGALLAEMMGDWREGKQMAERVSAFAETNDLLFWRAVGGFALGHARFMLGDRQCGRSMMQKSTEALSDKKILIFHPYFILTLARAHFAVDELNAATASIEHGRAIAARTGESWCDAGFARLEGELLRVGGKADAARDAFACAERLAERQGSRMEVLAARRALDDLRMAGPS